MKKKHFLRQVKLFYCLYLHFAQCSKFKKIRKTLFFSAYEFLSNQIQVQGLILTKISNPIRIYKKIKHFDLKSAILCTVFLLIMKRDHDRRNQKRPHKNHHQSDSLSLRPSLSIFLRTLLDATVTVTLQNQKKHCGKNPNSMLLFFFKMFKIE
jgi:hypothetical protein